MQQQWETVLQGLDNWLQVQNTHPAIWQELLSSLQQWQTGNTGTIEYQMTGAQEHTLLGWELMMEGVISRQ